MKQRVVGAIVLVALAVIFLPMLLDGSGRPERVDVPVEIPEEPTVPESRFQDAPATDDGPVAEPAPESGAGSGGAGAGQEAGAAGDDDGATAAPDADGGDADAGDGAADADDGSDASGDAGPSAWVVQVGSFAEETNALVLRDRLREQGFESFTEQGSSDGRAIWRVRVGPVPTRDRAESLKQRLEEQRGKAALVMAYP